MREKWSIGDEHWKSNIIQFGSYSVKYIWYGWMRVIVERLWQNNCLDRNNHYQWVNRTIPRFIPNQFPIIWFRVFQTFFSYSINRLTLDEPSFIHSSLSLFRERKVQSTDFGFSNLNRQLRKLQITKEKKKQEQQQQAKSSIKLTNKQKHKKKLNRIHWKDDWFM